MSINIKAYKCNHCEAIHKTKKEANNCCKCDICINYIGRYDKKNHWVHCRKGYTCDSYYSKGKEGTYSCFELK